MFGWKRFRNLLLLFDVQHAQISILMNKLV